MKTSCLPILNTFAKNHFYTRDVFQRDVINQLISLIPNLYKAGEVGRNSRIEFVCLALENSIEDCIISNQLIDEGWHGLGERQWAACFEGGDSEVVIAQVVSRARNDGYLYAVRDYCGTKSNFERWIGFSDIQLAML